MKPLPPELHKLAPYFNAVGPYLDRYGYWALFFGVMLEDFGVPLPGETLLIAAALLASVGEYNILLVAAVAFAAAVIGDNIGYAIGRFAGRPIILRVGKYVLITEERLGRLERYFARKGGWIIIIARFIEGLRQLNGIVAGLSHMPWRRFLTFNAVGAALWVAAWASAAYFFGKELGPLLDWMGSYRWIVLIAVVAALLVAWLLVHLVRKRAP
jgi:membrane protein DedA with SNARE-associated domain